MILVVGVGGIGCELVKGLLLSNHSQIHLIDLDTIELTNLNRQFLFQPKHIGQPKATVAAQVLLDQYSPLIPSLKIVPWVGNLFDGEKFPPFFFTQFSLIYGALDNLEARIHLNKICLTLGIPLIETGSAGYLGQTSVIVGGRTECFDCNDHPVPSVYPVCTIKNTPSTIAHCVIWAKEFLFNSLFNVNLKNEYVEDKETQEIWYFEGFMSSLGQDSPKLLASKLFIQDVERLLGMEELWKERAKPIPLSSELIQEQFLNEFSGYDSLEEHHVYGLEENIQLFFASFLRLSTHYSLPITFDKDNSDSVKFVTAASNIRAHIYGIDSKCLFEVKEIAGSIIPAVATTNSIVAGLAVITGNKLLEGKLDSFVTSFIAYGFETKLLSNQKISSPNPECKTCSSHRSLLTVKSTQTITINDLLEYFHSNFCSDCEITITSSSKLLYDIDFEAKINASLFSLDIKQGQFVSISVISFVNSTESMHNFDFLLETNPDQSEIFLVSNPIIPLSQSTKKQKIQEEEDENE